MSKLFVLLPVLAALGLGTAHAVDHPAAYLVTQDGAPVASAAGGCVRTGEWTADSRYRHCAPLPFTVSIEALFDFGSAALTAHALEALDALVEEFAAADYRSVQVTGHADALGGALYNRRLSQQRAAAVRDYLVAKGIEGAKVTFSGAGVARPLAGSLCEGFTGAALIACLQPDRHAEITLRGVDLR
jgi:OOP family OmpA-OmpF porin